MIGEARNAEVYSLNLRGHDSSNGKPGDVSYIGQYVDDIVPQIKKLKPTGKKILLAIQWSALFHLEMR